MRAQQEHRQRKVAELKERGGDEDERAACEEECGCGGPTRADETRDQRGPTEEIRRQKREPPRRTPQQVPLQVESEVSVISEEEGVAVAPVGGGGSGGGGGHQEAAVARRERRAHRRAYAGERARRERRCELV